MSNTQIDKIYSQIKSSELRRQKGGTNNNFDWITKFVDDDFDYATLEPDTKKNLKNDIQQFRTDETYWDSFVNQMGNVGLQVDMLWNTVKSLNEEDPHAFLDRIKSNTKSKDQRIKRRENQAKQTKAMKEANLSIPTPTPTPVLEEDPRVVGLSTITSRSTPVVPQKELQKEPFVEPYRPNLTYSELIKETSYEGIYDLFQLDDNLIKLNLLLESIRTGNNYFDEKYWKNNGSEGKEFLAFVEVLLKVELFKNKVHMENRLESLRLKQTQSNKVHSANFHFATRVAELLFGKEFGKETKRYHPDAFQNILDSFGYKDDIVEINMEANFDFNNYINTLEFTDFVSSKYTLVKFLEAREESNRKLLNGEQAGGAPEENLYFRKVGEQDKLYKKKDDDSDEVVKKIDEQGRNCYGTSVFISDEDSEKCNDYVVKCLSGQNVKDCKEYMTASNFPKVAEDEVNKMHPDILLATLQSFGFKSEAAPTDDNIVFNKFPSVQEWINSLSETLKDDSESTKIIEGISKNDNLKKYLQLIVNKVNANPGIANPGFTPSGIYEYVPEGKQDPRVEHLQGVKKLNKFNSRIRKAPKTSEVNLIHDKVIEFLKEYAVHTNMYGSLLNFGQFGGGEKWEAEFTNVKHLPIQVAGHLNDMYESIIENLQEGGKDLDSSDQSTIKNMINELKVLENKLFKSASYTEGYEDLLNMKQSGGGLITQENYGKFVTKRNDYFKRVSEKYDVIFPIIAKLSDACARETQ